MAFLIFRRSGERGTKVPRWETAALAVVASCCLFTVTSLADARWGPPPKFNDPEVTAYVQDLARFRDRYLAAVVAARRGDDREMKRLDAEVPQWQQRATRLLEKVQPGETKRYTQFVTRCGQTMVDAMLGVF